MIIANFLLSQEQESRQRVQCAMVALRESMNWPFGKLVNGHAKIDICKATQNSNVLIQAAALSAPKEMMEKAGEEANDLYAYMAKRWHHLGNIWINEAPVCLTRFLNKVLSVYLTQLDPIDHIGPGI